MSTDAKTKIIKQINDAHDIIMDIYTGRRLFSVEHFTRLEAALRDMREYVEAAL